MMIAKDFFHEGWERVEIPKRVKIVVWSRVLARAGGDPLKIQCEKCGLILGKKKFQYDHKQAEVFQRIPPAERPPITADDAWLIGEDCCHKDKTAGEVKALAKTKRLAAREAGAKPKSKSRWACGKDSPWKKSPDGSVKLRQKE